MITVKIAGPSQAQIIVDFIRRLAEYEKKLDKVTVTKKDIQHYMFEHKLAEAAIAYWNQKEVGLAVFYPCFSTFSARPGLYLEDLFVLPEYRNRHVGKALMSFLAQQAVNRGCSHLKFSVLHWNKKAIGFYQGLGAVIEDEWLHYNIQGDQLHQLARD
ncbi:MAG: GNAT family N-acetyltransferase [Actinomycetota bacterium]|nr:GNAT family N-acetyltransferase [Actinomycetota bacterium]